MEKVKTPNHCSRSPCESPYWAVFLKMEEIYDLLRTCQKQQSWLFANPRVSWSSPYSTFLPLHTHTHNPKSSSHTTISSYAARGGKKNCTSHIPSIEDRFLNSHWLMIQSTFSFLRCTWPHMWARTGQALIVVFLRVQQYLLQKPPNYHCHPSAQLCFLASKF